MDIEHELRRNVKDLQEQLQRAYKRIKLLQEEIHSLRRKIDPKNNFRSGMSGWALMDDPEYRS
jgi:peptidoglycan hydrolase CwlO-like protein